MLNHPLIATLRSIVKVRTRLKPSRKTRRRKTVKLLLEINRQRGELLETSQMPHLHICRAWSQRKIKTQKTSFLKCSSEYQSLSSQIPIKREKRKPIRKR